MKTHKIKHIVGSMTYIQIKFDLYKVFDCENKYVGLASNIGQPIFCI